MNTDPDQKWLAEHPDVLDEHVGQWMAVKDGCVLASGKDFKRVAADAYRLAPDALFQEVPEPHDLVYAVSPARAKQIRVWGVEACLRLA